MVLLLARVDYGVTSFEYDVPLTDFLLRFHFALERKWWDFPIPELHHNVDADLLDREQLLSKANLLVGVIQMLYMFVEVVYYHNSDPSAFARLTSDKTMLDIGRRAANVPGIPIQEFWGHIEMHARRVLRDMDNLLDIDEKNSSMDVTVPDTNVEDLDFYVAGDFDDLRLYADTLEFHYCCREDDFDS